MVSLSALLKLQACLYISYTQETDCLSLLPVACSMRGMTFSYLFSFVKLFVILQIQTPSCNFGIVRSSAGSPSPDRPRSRITCIRLALISRLCTRSRAVVTVVVSSQFQCSQLNSSYDCETGRTHLGLVCSIGARSWLRQCRRRCCSSRFSSIDKIHLLLKR